MLKWKICKPEKFGLCMHKQKYVNTRTVITKPSIFVTGSIGFSNFLLKANVLRVESSCECITVVIDRETPVMDSS